MHREAERMRVFTRRALLVGAGQLGLFSALGGRLYYLQVVDADGYALLADENRINHRLLPPERGRIFDRHGVPLARNSPTYRVLIVREQTTDLRATLEALGRLIALPETRIHEVILAAKERRPFVPIAVREDLNWAEVARISIHSPELPGVSVVSGLIREYPPGSGHGARARLRRAGREAGAEWRSAAGAARVPDRQERHREDLRSGAARPRRPQSPRGQRARPRDQAAVPAGRRARPADPADHRSRSSALRPWPPERAAERFGGDPGRAHR